MAKRKQMPPRRLPGPAESTPASAEASCPSQPGSRCPTPPPAVSPLPVMMMKSPSEVEGPSEVPSQRALKALDLLGKEGQWGAILGQACRIA